MSAYEQLAALAAAPYAKNDDRPLMAVFPMWFPYETLLAADLRVSEWWGYESGTDAADAHFPAYICTVVKTNFEMMLAGEHVPDGMVFPSATCDSIQNSAGLFRRLFPGKFSTYFRMSQNPESAAAAEFVQAEIRRVLADIADYTGRSIDDEALRAAIASTNRFRRAVRELLGKMAAGKTSVPARRIYTALRGAVADIGETTAALLEQFTAEVATDAFAGPKLFLVGMTAEPFGALDVLEDAGAHVVGDDLGLGWRTFAVDAPETGDPVVALSKRLLTSPPCSSLHFAERTRAMSVVERARQLEADGVVFTRIKFCDPEAFDYPNMKKALDEANIPSLLLERELSTEAGGATATRLEAFLEQIG